MEKTIYCLIDNEQCIKSINFKTKKNKSDKKMIRRCLDEKRKNYSDLNQAMEGKEVVFKIKDNNTQVLHEIGENEVIEDKSEVSVIILPPDVERLSQSLAEIAFDEKKDNGQLRQTLIPLNGPLPQFTLNLKKRFDEHGITPQNRKYFIAHWGSYLWYKTDGMPKRKDYSNLTQQIISAYPTLQAGEDGCRLVQLLLSIWIRNHRRNLKVTTNRGSKRDHNGYKKLPTSRSALIHTDSIEDLETDIQYKLQELEKKHVKNVNISHIKQLLKTTLHNRRPWIENEADRIIDIINKYPSHKDDRMILYEFLNLRNLRKADVFNKIDVMIHNIMNYFNFEDDKTELTKMRAIEALYNKLLSIKFK